MSAPTVNSYYITYPDPITANTPPVLWSAYSNSNGYQNTYSMNAVHYNLTAPLPCESITVYEPVMIGGLRMLKPCRDDGGNWIYGYAPYGYRATSPNQPTTAPPRQICPYPDAIATDQIVRWRAAIDPLAGGKIYRGGTACEFRGG